MTLRENIQLDVFQVHATENTISNQKHLDENRDKFSKKCKVVYDWLMEGKELTVLWAANNGVSSLPRRIKDLRDNNSVLISSKWENGCIVYYMDKEQIHFNKYERK